MPAARPAEAAPRAAQDATQRHVMDIGYFLKLMTEKGASDMFLTTGAPVNI